MTNKYYIDLTKEDLIFAGWQQTGDMFISPSGSLMMCFLTPVSNMCEYTVTIKKAKAIVKKKKIK